MDSALRVSHVATLILKAGVNTRPTGIEREIVAMVREKIEPVAAFKLAITVNPLLKTRPGRSSAAP